MKICIFNGGRLGVVENGYVLDVTGVMHKLPVAKYPYPKFDAFISSLPELLPAITEACGKASRLSLSDVRLECPVQNPGKVIAAPVNYQAHLEEAIADTATFARAHVRVIQETGLFLKANSSLVGPSDKVCIVDPERRTDHELELVAVIGKRAKNVSKAEALDYVAGYSVGLDMTIRGPEERSLRKSPDTYTVLGPWLVTADEIPDPQVLDMMLSVNGDVRQEVNTKDMIMKVAELIEFSSRFYTLEPGDLLYTGTPEGVGPVTPGDVIECNVECIGTLRVEIE